MTQYRLLEKDVDTIARTDEYWDGIQRQWNVVPGYLVGQVLIGAIPYRRAMPKQEPGNKTVVLQEWLCWDNEYPDAFMIRWSSTDPTVKASNLTAWDNAVFTGNVREIELIG